MCWPHRRQLRCPPKKSSKKIQERSRRRADFPAAIVLAGIVQTLAGIAFRAAVEVPWTWEKESRGQKPKSLKKVSKKSPGPGSQKSEKGLEKGPKSLQKPIFRLFFDFSRLFSDFWGPAPGDFSRFFETFWLRAPRLLLAGPRNLNAAGELKKNFPAACSNFAGKDPSRTGGGQICLCVPLSLGRERKHINKNPGNFRKASGQSRDTPRIIPGQSREIFIYRRGQKCYKIIITNVIIRSS